MTHKQLSSLSAAMLLALLAACQTPAGTPPTTQTPRTPTTHTQIIASALPQASNQTAAQIYKPGTQDNPLPASIQAEPGKKTDKLVLALDSRFRTQGVSLSQFKFVKVSVKGTDITTNVSTALISIAGTTVNVNLPGIPQGKNRVITAQFYDANQLEIPSGVAKGIYSSGGSGAIPVQIRRRFLPLADILEQLMTSNPTLASSLTGSELTQMQNQIDMVVYGAPYVDGSPFTLDPTRLNTVQMASDIAGNPSQNLNNPAYVNPVSSLNITVNGLVGTDTVTVRVGDPTSTPVTQAGGAIMVSNISPGKWPIYINVDKDFPYPNSTLAGQSVAPILASDQFTAGPTIAPQTFAAGTPVNLGAYNLSVGQPTVTQPGEANTQNRHDQILFIKGQNFYPAAAQNTVEFYQTSPPTMQMASVLEASTTQLKVRIPTINGAYKVRVSTAGSSQVEAGSYDIKAAGFRWYVAPDGQPDAAGISWSSPTTLKHALADAGDDEELWIKQGTYRPDDTGTPFTLSAAIDPTPFFEISKSLSLLGGFAGNETSAANRSRNPALTVLSGDLQNNDDPNDTGLNAPSRQDNAGHVVKITGGSPNVDGLTITGGNQRIDNGGGMLINGMTYPLLTNLVFHHNNASAKGGGLAIIDGEGGQTVLQDVTIRDNTANAGGGLYHSTTNGGSVRLTRTIFERNKATNVGGGLAGNMTIMKVLDSVFSKNEAVNQGGGVWMLHAPSFSLDFTNRYDWFNVVFSENAAKQGGGMYFSGSTSRGLRLGHITMANNRFNTLLAADNPCGAGIYTQGSKPVEIMNSLIWSNETHPLESQLAGRWEYSACAGGTGSYQIDFSLVDGISSGMTYTHACCGPNGPNLDANPQFVNLANPAGPDGMFLSADDGLKLSPTSPANNISYPPSSEPPNDILGTPRAFPPSSADPGAYENP